MSQDSPPDANGRPRDGDAPDVPEGLRRRWASLGDDEPPALVDQAVLTRARSAVEGEAPHSSRPWSFGWIHTVTTAAVIVLGATVVLQLGEPTAPAPPTTLENRAAPGEASGDSTSGPPRSPQAAPAAARARSASPANGTDSEAAFDARQAPRALIRETVPAAAAEAAPGASTDTALESDDADASPDPDAWLEEIRALIDAGREAEAQAEFERFRRAWPDHPLPDDFPGAARLSR